MRWPKNWELCGRFACDRASVPDLRDEFWARQWLERFQRNPAKMLAIRTFLLAGMGAKDVYRRTDGSILAQLAGLLACGRVHIHAVAVEGFDSVTDEPWRSAVPPVNAASAGAGSGGGSSTGSPSRSDALPASQSPSRVPVAPYRETNTDPPTFSGIDVAAQVAALRAAAADGMPFCPQ